MTPKEAGPYHGPCLPAGPFTLTGTVAKPCWDKPSATRSENVVRAHGQNNEAWQSYPAGRGCRHIPPCSTLTLLMKTNPQTGCSCSAVWRGSRELRAALPAAGGSLPPGAAVSRQQAIGKEAAVIFISPDSYLPLLSSTPSSPAGLAGQARLSSTRGDVATKPVCSTPAAAALASASPLLKVAAVPHSASPD